jgi:energy-coupling factor transporter transmembrane protein EcfT
VVAGQVVRARWSALVWRSRWLLLVLALTYLLSTPGEAIRAGYWPTWEGLHNGVEQGGRLVAVLGAVAWLLATTPVSRLVAGIYGLGLAVRGRRRAVGAAGPAGRAERAAVRLALVLRYAETAKASDWRALLQPAADFTGEPVVIDLPAMTGRDWGLAGVALLLVVVAWWGGA